MKHILNALLFGLLLTTTTARAQGSNGKLEKENIPLHPVEINNCPFDQIFNQASKNNPNFKQELLEHERKIAKKIAKKNKNLIIPPSTNFYKTAAQSDTIPVIFHIVLTASQTAQMGGQDSIINRIKSQLLVLNQDFNAANSDSTQIPLPFKPFYANMDIKFGFTHTDPNGNFTKGYEFITTSKNGFDANPGSGTAGSTNFCSDAKYSSSGGADAWDTQKYLNIWVINITPYGVGGVGTPPPYAIYGGTGFLPWAEQGVVLSYVALGKQSSSGQYFPAASAKNGRALVHEIGHFFDLFHPFGMSSSVNINCADDDGVSDTPLQHTNSQGNPAFPVTDSCSTTSPGIMFMNHMDYTDDSHRVMFTNGQKARAWVEVDSGGYRFELFRHPELLHNASMGVKEIHLTNSFKIYPNPAQGSCTIIYDSNNIPESFAIINQLGQTAMLVRTDNSSEVSIDLNSLQKGLYFIRCHFRNGNSTAKLLIN